MRQLILILFIISLSLFGYTQNIIPLATGTTTTITVAPSSSTVYYGPGTLDIKPPFDFKGSTGDFITTNTLIPIESTPPTNIAPTTFSANFINNGAFVYVITVNDGSKTTTTIVT